MTFGDELTNRLKVIACIEKPNMLHSEVVDDAVGEKNWTKIRSTMNTGKEDAQVILWGPEADIPTALETVEERCRMAFAGVPNETRKSFEDGTTIFERVLPGADRMYPDTDSAPIPLEDTVIARMAQDLPTDISDRIVQLIGWKIPEDTFIYILKNNLVPLIEQVYKELEIQPRFSGTLLAHTLKHIQGQNDAVPGFRFDQIYRLLAFLKQRKLDSTLAKKMLWILYQHPKMDFESVLETIKFREVSRKEILAKIPFLINKFNETRISDDHHAGVNWIMGNLRKSALGNISLTKLSEEIKL